MNKNILQYMAILRMSHTARYSYNLINFQDKINLYCNFSRGKYLVKLHHRQSVFSYEDCLEIYYENILSTRPDIVNATYSKKYVWPILLNRKKKSIKKRQSEKKLDDMTDSIKKIMLALLDEIKNYNKKQIDKEGAK